MYPYSRMCVFFCPQKIDRNQLVHLSSCQSQKIICEVVCMHSSSHNASIMRKATKLNWRAPQYSLTIASVQLSEAPAIPGIGGLFPVPLFSFVSHPFYFKHVFASILTSFNGLFLNIFNFPPTIVFQSIENPPRLNHPGGRSNQNYQLRQSYKKND